MGNRLNFRHVCKAFVFSFLVVMVGLLAAPTAEAAPGSKVKVIVEDGVPEAFSDDIIRAVDYMEKFYMEKYHLAFERDVRIVITPNKEAYTVARMREGGESREKAERHAKFASGNSFDATNTIVLNGGHPLMASNTAKRVKTTIHELTHQVQAQLSGDRWLKQGHIWIGEGSANSLAFRVMDYGGFSKIKQERIDWFKNVVNTGKKIPRPEALSSRDAWLDFMDKKYNAYGVGTSMTEFLIDRTGGYDCFITYYKELKTNDKETAFKKAFGMSEDEFMEKYVEYYDKEILAARGEAEM